MAIRIHSQAFNTHATKYRNQQQAIEYATDTNGVVNLTKKQSYLDSIWNEPVYTIFGADFTYKEIKDTELNLGLDLQGGMHVTLEVSPVDILKGLSGNNEDAAFLAAIAKAKEAQKNSQESFSSLFYNAFRSVSTADRNHHLEMICFPMN